jgi:MoaA/NifB/PqqE/SkfB family radical SAM enzyme
MSKEYENFVKKHGKSFCALPFTEIANSAQGHSMLCCYSETVEANLYKEEFINNWESSNVLNDIRQKMLDNKPIKSCTRCYQYEESGAYNMSKRYTITRQLEKENPDLLNKIKQDSHLELRTIDIKFGNKCNLACVMCDGHSSSLHVKEKRQHKVPVHLKKHIPDDAVDNGFHKKQLDELISTAHTLQKVKFTGGEPTLLEGFREFIDMLSKTPYAKNISVMMVTNGTTNITKMIDTMSKFKNYEVHWSTDGLGSTFEYIRWPAKWDKVSSNQSKFNTAIKEHKNINSILTSAIQLLNFNQLPDLVRYTEQNNFNEFIPVLVMWPKPLDLAIIPNNIKEQVVNETVPLIKQSAKFSFVSDFIEIIKKRKTVYTYDKTQEFLAYYDKARGYSAEKMCSIISQINKQHFDT